MRLSELQLSCSLVLLHAMFSLPHPVLCRHQQSRQLLQDSAATYRLSGNKQIN